MAIEISEAGFLSLLQDRGRFGHHRIGLTTGGPMDLNAYRICNKLLGNPEDAAVVEVTLGGLVVAATADHLICVTGAPVELKINDEILPLWSCHQLKSGDTLSLKASDLGLRSYLGVANGFDIESKFDSVSTVVREKVGGLNGEKLAAGDILNCGDTESTLKMKLLSEQHPIYNSHASLRVIPGYQYDYFSRIDVKRFFSNRYKVSDRSDRMGYRLLGPSIHSKNKQLLSEGISLGAIQIPADGQPIVLLNDRQTIGGYPKLGSVLSLDVSLLAQLRPGNTVEFKPISIETAHNLIHLNEYFINELKMTELM